MTDQEQKTPKKQDVIERIRRAFHAVKLGNGIGLMEARGHDDYADKETLASYRSRDEKEDWSRIGHRVLYENAGGMTFLDAEGMRFHLAALLIADLEGVVFPATDMVFELTASTNYARSRFDLLNEEQRQAVRDYLRLQLATATFDKPLIERALAEYWNCI